MQLDQQPPHHPRYEFLTTLPRRDVLKGQFRCLLGLSDGGSVLNYRTGKVVLKLWLWQWWEVIPHWVEERRIECGCDRTLVVLRCGSKLLMWTWTLWMRHCTGFVTLGKTFAVCEVLTIVQIKIIKLWTFLPPLSSQLHVMVYVSHNTLIYVTCKKVSSCCW